MRLFAGLLVCALSLSTTTLAETTAPMSVRDARQKVLEKEIDDLYLAFVDLQPGDHPEGDEAVTTVLLEAVGAALAIDDGHIAIALAGVARRLSPRSTETALAVAQASLSLNLRGAAAEVLDEALETGPEDGEVIFQRARLAETENDERLASDLYGRVPAGHPRHAASVEGANRMGQSAAAREATLAEIARAEAEVRDRQEAYRSGKAPGPRRGRDRESRSSSPRGRRSGDFDPGSGEYLISDLSAAREAARASGKPIAIIYTNPATTCGLARRAFNELRSGLGGHAILVFASTQDSDGLRAASQTVLSALASPQSGIYIPKTVVFNASLNRVIVHVPYAQDDNERARLLREAQAAIRSHGG